MKDQEVVDQLNDEIRPLIMETEKTVGSDQMIPWLLGLATHRYLSVHGPERTILALSTAINAIAPPEIDAKDLN